MKLWIALMLLVACAGVAQEIQFEKPAGGPTQHVMLLDDAISVAAGKAEDIELRFRVGPGLHVNSHAPKDELLIPTTLKLENSPGIAVMAETFPAGSAFRLGDETLDVYQGEFRVRVRVNARAGESTLTGALRYQACDTASCFPPRTLPVKVIVTAK